MEESSPPILGYLFWILIIAYFVYRRRKKKRRLERMRYLFFDTETTGLPKRQGGRVEQLRIVQLACLLTDRKGNVLETYNHIIRPEGYEIPEESQKIHGISTEKALAEGVSIEEAVSAFLKLYDRCDVVVAHNLEFDMDVIVAEADRIDAWKVRKFKDTFDTMKPLSKYVGIYMAWKKDYKWPTLQELHTKVFGYEFDGAHDALADVRACARCFFELKKRGVIKK